MYALKGELPTLVALNQLAEDRQGAGASRDAEDISLPLVLVRLDVLSDAESELSACLLIGGVDVREDPLVAGQHSLLILVLRIVEPLLYLL